MPLLKKVDLDEKARGLPPTIPNRDEYRPYKIPTCDKRPEEPELKFIIPDTHKVQKIYADIHERHKKPNGVVTLADNRVIARDPLVSFALDTKHFDIMRTTGEQLRVRGPLNLAEADHADPTEVIWRGQATVKTLFSEAAGIGADRVEIEAAIPSRDIRDAFKHFLEHDKPHLNSLYYETSPEDLSVAAICITPRASFNSVVLVPEYDAFVEFEHTCDPNYFLTPNADVRAGKDMEFEAEAKMIYARPELGLTDTQKKEIYTLAKDKYRDFVAKNWPDFEEAKYSKVERAVRAVGKFYNKNHAGTATSNFVQTEQHVAELASMYGMKIARGMAHAIRQGVSLCQSVSRVNEIAAIAKDMAQPSTLIPVNDAQKPSTRCAADDRRNMRLRA